MWSRTSLSVGLALALGACGEAAAPAGGTAPATPADAREVAAGHERMLALLEEVRAQAREDNLYVGERAVREARAALAALPADADPKTRLGAHVALANAEGRLGNEAAAIEHWTAAYDSIAPLGEALSRQEATEIVYRLALAYMRLGETKNCCARNTAESCLLPIRGGGVHTDTEGSRQAIRCFTEVLERTKGAHLRARWLLNIAYMTVGGYPDEVPRALRIPPKAFESEAPFPRFENVAPRLGLDTFNLYGGVVADDLDADGYVDIFTASSDPTAPLHFFRNEHDGTFTDRAKEAGLERQMGGLNMIQADADGDGDTDVFVLRGAWLRQNGRYPNSLLANDGHARFTDATFVAGLGEVHYPTQAGGWSDYDNDGDVDLYIGNESDAGLTAPCQLFRNRGDGRFEDVARAAGVDNVGFTKGVTWGDQDGDRFPDLYVSNMAGPNRLYRNRGDGTFVDVAPALGVDGPRNSFPIWFWDYDNDGALDLYVPSYRGEAGALQSVVASILGQPHTEEQPCLYRGDGRGGFTEVARETNLTKLTFPMGCNFGDLDSDGFLDFYLGTGFPDYEALLPNVLYHNERGQRFADVTYAAGMGHLQKGHAIAFADLDLDGDQDVFAQMGGAFRGDKFNDCLFENPGFGNHWLGLELVGVRSNRSAIGARIRADVLEAGTPRTIYKHVNSGGSFGSSPLRQTIGLGSASELVRLEIYWPTSDTHQVFEHVPMDRILRIVELEERYEVRELPAAPFATKG
jgi:tetratricopeptide (TPR) repeat protein